MKIEISKVEVKEKYLENLEVFEDKTSYWVRCPKEGDFELSESGKTLCMGKTTGGLAKIEEKVFCKVGFWKKP